MDRIDLKELIRKAELMSSSFDINLYTDFNNDWEYKLKTVAKVVELDIENYLLYIEDCAWTISGMLDHHPDDEDHIGQPIKGHNDTFANEISMVIPSKVNLYVAGGKNLKDLNGLLEYKVLNKVNFSLLESKQLEYIEETFSMSTINTVELDGLNTSNVKSMKDMFSLATIENMDISKLDTSSVENMKSMFFKSKIACKLDFSTWNTKNAINFSNMFSMCEFKHPIDLSCIQLRPHYFISEMFAYAEIPEVYLPIVDDDDKIDNSYLEDMLHYNKINIAHTDSLVLEELFEVSRLG